MPPADGQVEHTKSRASPSCHLAPPNPTAERTTAGCLCAPEWRVDGVGKSSYRNRCAHPDSESQRKCLVDYASCPSNAAVSDFDACAAAPPPAVTADAAPAAPAETTTYHNCSCIEGGWWYLYPSGAAGAAPVNKTLAGCANPDGDPLGAWCPVDPAKCDRFAGHVGVDPVKPWAFDYCGAEAPSTPKFSGACKLWVVPAAGQCSGQSNCTNYACAGEQWQGACCVAGPEPRRPDAHSRQSVRAGTAADLAAVRSGSGDGAAAPSSPEPAAASMAGDSSSDAAPPPVVDAASSALPSLQPKVAGAIVYVRVQIDYDFALIAADVGAQARFKSDLVAWLRGNAADPQLVHSAGGGVGVAKGVLGDCFQNSPAAR